MSLPHVELDNSNIISEFDEEEVISPLASPKEPRIIAIKIPDDLKGLRLDAALAMIIPDLSRSRLTNWIKSNHILVNNQHLKPKDKVLGGEDVQITAQFDETTDSEPENIPLNIIYEDEHLIVINKPAGLVVHPGAGNWHGTLLNAILYHHPEAQYIPRSGIVHRLDKDTTGLMVVAKTIQAQTNLVIQLQERSVSRIYRAIVHGHPPKSGSINKNIGRDPKNRIKMAIYEHGGKPAITNYRVLEYFKDFSYIECKLETGRTHQIRAHLKSINHPLVADPLYGSRKTNFAPNITEAIKQLNRQALHALKLSFNHPLYNELMKFRVPIALDMKNLLNEISKGEYPKDTHNREHALHDTTTLDFNSDTDDDTDDEFNWEIIYAK